MRNRHLRVASTLAASFVSLALFACSGASTQDVAADADAGATGTIPDPGTGSTTGSPSGSTGTTDPGTTTTIPGTNGSADAGAPGDAAADGGAPKGDAGPVTDAGPKPPLADGGDAGSLPITCSGTLEKEPNDKPAEATPFTSSICGQLKPKDDVDYVSFALALDAKRIDATYSSTGPVTFHVTVKGMTFEALGPTSPAIPFYPGETYLFDVGSTAKNPVAYELTVKTQ